MKANTRNKVPHQHNPRRDRLVLRKGLRLCPDLQRKEPLFPRLRRRCRTICEVKRLDRQGWSHLLPTTRPGPVGEREGYPQRERSGHREYAGLCKRAGDNCLNLLRPEGFVRAIEDYSNRFTSVFKACTTDCLNHSRKALKVKERRYCIAIKIRRAYDEVPVIHVPCNEAGTIYILSQYPVVIRSLCNHLRLRRIQLSF